ncbi:hypothetical protein D3C76_1613470 [compost metagenome]
MANATVVAVSMLLYASTFLPLITSNGFSPAKGSGRMLSPVLKLEGAVVRPPL